MYVLFYFFIRLFILFCISEVITTKNPNLNIKDISSQLSRWFSGAKDRESGKKERQNRILKVSY